MDFLQVFTDYYNLVLFSVQKNIFIRMFRYNYFYTKICALKVHYNTLS